MGINWLELDEVEATEFILRSAIHNHAGSLSIVRDSQGADIFFACGEHNEQLEMFEHIPPETCCSVFRYLKRMAAIDPYKGPPQEGFSCTELDEKQYTLTISSIKGSVGESLTIKISSL